MSDNNEGSTLSRRVAEAADAHLRDPLDVHAYEHFVERVLAWRKGAMPTLDGLADTGRPTLEEIERASRASAERMGTDVSAMPDPDDPRRRPQPVAGLMDGVLADLRRRGAQPPS